MDDFIRLIFRILYYIFLWWILDWIFNPDRKNKNRYNNFNSNTDDYEESSQDNQFAQMNPSKLEESYGVLGVTSEISDKELKKVYLQLAKKYHPDSVESSETEETKMAEINSAYQYICEARKIRK
ncbi:J domain-containing protein [Spiroplasma endosymbiont of Panorpa germanica]|uniref:J domain-containing protein n=1 Tax=Spiroplasma endosymbiont of Panorpa germanica TaxID=3066314 RepID=UPI0030D1C284